jgi:hypothetical protein
VVRNNYGTALFYAVQFKNRFSIIIINTIIIEIPILSDLIF